MSAATLSNLEDLQRFHFDRALDPISRTIALLGSFPAASATASSGSDGPSSLANDEIAGSQGSRLTAIVRIEQLSWNPNVGENLVKRLYKTQSQLSNDIYSTFVGWIRDEATVPNVKINIICPATEIHIRKYSRQEFEIVRETPHLYETIVKPYIQSFPPSRTQWVNDILDGKSEADRVLYSSPDFILLPDMKWDCVTVSSLYLVAIARSTRIRSLRDLRKTDVGFLLSIKENAERVVLEKWGLGKGGIRMYIHYQPSYYHFHVHVVNVNVFGYMGMTVGQAHLLEDIISFLELDPDDGPSILERMTLTYGLGKEHKLYDPLTKAQAA